MDVKSTFSRKYGAISVQKLAFIRGEYEKMNSQWADRGDKIITLLSVRDSAATRQPTVHLAAL